MHFKKRIISVLIICALTGSVLFATAMGILGLQGEESLFARSHRETLYLWYTQSSLTDYLSSAAAAYNENSRVRVEPVLVPSTEYMEQINDASLSDGEIPDLFITTNDTLAKAYLAGLACEVPDKRGVLSTSFFPKAALNAVSTEGRKVAYPLSFETTALFVNVSYLEEYATNLVLAETATEGGEEEKTSENGQKEGEEETSGNDAAPELTPEQQQMVEEKVQSFLPETFTRLEEFANGYDAPEQVENIFKWDVSSIFYNYAFPGAYLNVGGENGDDPEQIDLYNLSAIRALNAYQKLHQFFFFEKKDSKYADVIREFTEGKTVFTIGGIDAVHTLEQARADGTFPYEYLVLPLPAISEELATRPLSVTTVVAVNGYSEHIAQADDFAAFLACDYTDPLYTYTGRLSANLGATYDCDAFYTFRSIYDGSVSMPKMLETGNFWIQLEIALGDIWNGADANQTLKQVAETIATQVKGETVELERLTLPVEEEETQEEITDETETDGES
ncbi:MAG: extracellular solute-binding protein [Lachnospiraceae bacterium]|nr:extracellular solute-binding protein [Lachnospiraceae bacterium]